MECQKINLKKLQNKKKENSIQNSEISNYNIKKESNVNINCINNNEQIEDSQKVKKENEIDNINSKNINEFNKNLNNNKISQNIINIDNSINYDLNNSNYSNKDNINNKIELNNTNNKAFKKGNIHISYNPEGNINLEDIQNKQKLELLHKQQNIFLGNELTLLKCKLNKIRKENEFLQSLIHEKGMVKNTNVLEKFIGGFVEKLSLNWNEIVESIIDEILIDEIHELNEIELNKINYEKKKKILIRNLNNDGIRGIIPEGDEEEYANADLLLGSIEQIKKILNSVKESKNNIKAKYNL